MKKIMKYAGRAFSIALSIVLAALTAFTVYVISCNAAGRVPEVFGISVLKVITGSMEPSIYEGDYIFLEKTDADMLKKGDIIAFYSEDPAIYDMPNTHRIIDVRSDGTFVTKGDANEIKDSIPVKPERVIGKYTGRARFFKWISSFASAQKLLILLAILPLLGASVYEVITISRIRTEIKGEKAEKQKAEKEKLIQKAVEKEKQRLYEEAEKKKNESCEDGGEEK